MFTKTAGFRHPSIADGISGLEALAADRGWQITHTEDAAVFDDASLTGFDVVVFLNTSGDILLPNEQAAFERYIRAGGGFVGVHAAADTEYDWAWYGDLVGAWFQDHPAVQPATIRVEDRTHESTQHLGPTWMRTDEWYNFRTNPRARVTVMLSLDEATYQGGTMGDHPIAWYHAFDGGRAFYTGLGHTGESYADPDFREHLAGAIDWAAGRTGP